MNGLKNLRGFTGNSVKSSSNHSVCVVRCEMCSSEDCRYSLRSCVSVAPNVASPVKRENSAVEECSLAHNPDIGA